MPFGNSPESMAQYGAGVLSAVAGRRRRERQPLSEKYPSRFRGEGEQKAPKIEEPKRYFKVPDLFDPAQQIEIPENELMNYRKLQWDKRKREMDILKDLADKDETRQEKLQDKIDKQNEASQKYLFDFTQKTVEANRKKDEEEGKRRYELAKSTAIEEAKQGQLDARQIPQRVKILMEEQSGERSMGAITDYSQVFIPPSQRGRQPLAQMYPSPFMAETEEDIPLGMEIGYDRTGQPIYKEKEKNTEIDFDSL